MEATPAGPFDGPGKDWDFYLSAVRSQLRKAAGGGNFALASGIGSNFYLESYHHSILSFVSFAPWESCDPMIFMSWQASVNGYSRS